jgi:23S rRNA (pseudouridine1915-N3)-methyltransferase
MFNITILAVGKIKEKKYREGVEEYLKRVKPYARVVVHELESEPFSKNNKKQSKDTEALKIIKYLDKQEGKFVIALDEKGQHFTSKEFSEFLSTKNQEIIFIIGGSLGLSQEIFEKVNAKISLSKMTFPHEVARLLLCEQIYRAITIEKGKVYHY